MRYAELIDGQIRYHGVRNPIINADGSRTLTSNPALLAAGGFYPVSEIPPPECPEGYMLHAAWILIDGVITQQWTIETSSEIGGDDE